MLDRARELLAATTWPPDPPAQARPAAVGTQLSLRRYAVAGLVAGVVIVLGAMSGGASFVSHMAGAWFFGTPGGPLSFMGSNARHAPAVSILAVYGGIAALAAIWWRLLRALQASPGVSVSRVVRVIAAWGAPYLVAPPLFSRDVFSYAGQGAMVSFHIDPYHYGPGVLGVTRFNLLAGPLWANSPSPYGPTFLSLDGVVTRLSGHEVLPDLLLLRLLAVVGVALVVAGMPTLARWVGRDPALTVVFAAGSPLVLTTLVGGAHNDALMLGLLVAGLAVWRRVGPIPGIVLCALAAGVKAPAALGIVLIGWNWAGPGARLREAFGRTLAALGIGAAVLMALSAATGVGWGWVGALSTPGRVSTGVTPVDSVARIVVDVLHPAGLAISASSVRSVVALVGLGAAAVIGARLLWRSPRDGPLAALGWSLLVLALLGPVLWAWYASWGLVLLAPCVTGRARRVVIWLTVAQSLVGASSVIGIFHALDHEGALKAAMVVAGVGAAALVAARAPYERTRRPVSEALGVGALLSEQP